MLKAVLPVTGRAANADGIECIDVGLTAGMGTLCGSQESRLSRTSTYCSRRKRSSFPPCGRPFAGAGTFVSCFCAVIKAVGTFAGFTAEGKEIKLVAVGVLAVSTDRFDVFVHDGKGLGLLRRRGSRRGRHDG